VACLCDCLLSSTVCEPPSCGEETACCAQLLGEIPPDLPNSALLSSVAVAKDRRGLGVGRMLVASFVESAREAGVSFVTLAADSDGPQTQHGFYVSCGFSLHNCFLRDGKRLMGLYMRSLSGAQATDHCVTLH
jgi:GNAT superfamily N-acetyltransferase